MVKNITDDFTEFSQTALFPGLIDICLTDEGNCEFAQVENGELVFSETHHDDDGTHVPPSKKHLHFTIPRASKVKQYFKQEDHTLLEDIEKYFNRFSHLTDWQRTIISHFAVATHFLDHAQVTHCPYLFFYGPAERGKTRSAKAVSYISNRGSMIGELREAIIFRLIDRLRGTLCFDLENAEKKAIQSNTNDILLLGYEKDIQVMRITKPDAGKFEDIEYFDIFGMKILISNNPFNSTLLTRGYLFEQEKSDTDFEAPRPEYGLDIKERLVALKAKYLNHTFPTFVPPEGIVGRLWLVSKILYMVNSLLSDSTDKLTEALLIVAKQQDEHKRDCPEGRFTETIKTMSEEDNLDHRSSWILLAQDVYKTFNDSGLNVDSLDSARVGKLSSKMKIEKGLQQGVTILKFTQETYAKLLSSHGFTPRDIKESRGKGSKRGKEEEIGMLHPGLAPEDYIYLEGHVQQQEENGSLLSYREMVIDAMKALDNREEVKENEIPF